MSNNNKQDNSNDTLKNKICDMCDRLRDDKNFAMKVGIGVLAVLLFVIVIFAVSCGSEGENTQVPNDGVVSSNEVGAEHERVVSQNEVISGESVSADNLQIPTNPIEQVNGLIEQYFQAMADGNTDLITSIKSDMSQEEILTLQKKSNYIEQFANLNVLTKDGPVANSYVSFVYYEIKFKDIETLAPGLTTLYLCNNEAGELHIYDGELDESVTEFIKGIAAAEDVKAIFERVEVKYNEATDADTQLKAFMESLPKTLEQEVTAELQAQQPEEEQGAEQPQEQPAEEQPQQAEKVVTTDTVNVRSSDSENADKLGKLEAGTTVTRYETKENGWSKIDYNGKEAYVKSEYLQVAGTETTDAENTDEGNETTQDTSNVETVEGKVVVLETVNVRKSASETAERIGTAYQGEYYELIMKQADGWTKIKFNGQTGYVKSEFVK